MVIICWSNRFDVFILKTGKFMGSFRTLIEAETFVNTEKLPEENKLHLITNNHISAKKRNRA